MTVPPWAPAVAVSLAGLGLSIYMARRQVSAAWLAEHDERTALQREIKELDGILHRVQALESKCESRVQALESKCESREALSNERFTGVREALSVVRSRLQEVVDEMKERRKS